VLIAGCGASSKNTDSKTTPSAYVSEVCAAVGTWLRSLDSSSAQIGRQLAYGTTPTRAKQAFEELMASSVTDSERLVSGLQAAGTPEVPEGHKIATALVGSVQQTSAALRGVQVQVKELPVNDRNAFRSGVSRIGSSVQSSAQSISSGLASLHSPALQKAAGRSAACKSLGTSGSAA
jgi:hypothetical protein